MASHDEAEHHHVENPFEFVIEKLTWGVADVARAVIPHPERHVGQAVPQVRRIGVADLVDALRKAWGDVMATRDDVLFIGVIYPVAGLVLAQLAFGNDLLPMIFPLASGFALIGPVAAVGLYEMSRQRERGDHVTWATAFDALRSPAIGSILWLGLVFLALFGLWLLAAYEINLAIMGAAAPPTFLAFTHNVLWTQEGWTLIAAGLGVGFLFAVAAFMIGVISFPLLLDRDVGTWRAVSTSFRAVAKNPGVMALWGLIVAGGLLLGSLPALVGLIVVMPLLGHATWHLYRKVVV